VPVAPEVKQLPVHQVVELKAPIQFLVLLHLLVVVTEVAAQAPHHIHRHQVAMEVAEAAHLIAPLLVQEILLQLVLLKVIMEAPTMFRVVLVALAAALVLRVQIVILTLQEFPVELAFLLRFLELQHFMPVVAVLDHTEVDRAVVVEMAAVVQVALPVPAVLAHQVLVVAVVDVAPAPADLPLWVDPVVPV
jgi:hypothetical protein